MTKTQPKASRPSFGDYKPHLRPGKPVLDRDTFAGLGPRGSYERIRRFLESRRDYRAITLHQKGTVIRRILKDLQDRGLDLASVTPDDMAAYREFLRALVEAERFSQSYAAHVVSQWNSVARAVFGVKGQPGETLLMRGFREEPKRVEHLTQDEFDAIVRASRERPHASDHHRDAFTTYLEVAWSTGARIGSMLNGNLRVEDIDWDHQTVRFRHMKNLPEHTAVMTPRAMVALRRWIDHLRTTRGWRGGVAPVFAGPDGKPLSPQWVNRTLKYAAARAGITRPITTHTIRKSVGTLIGRENPKFAQMQLGITAKIFNEHYNQPLLEDRLARRDLLPGSDWKPQTAEEIAGKAYLEYQSGRLSKADLEAQVDLAQTVKDAHHAAKDCTAGYA